MAIKLKDYLRLFKRNDLYEKDCVHGKKGVVKSTVLKIYLVDPTQLPSMKHNETDWLEQRGKQTLIKNDDERFFDYIVFEKYLWSNKWENCGEIIYITEATKGDE